MYTTIANKFSENEAQWNFIWIPKEIILFESECLVFQTAIWKDKYKIKYKNTIMLFAFYGCAS